ncbi:MAG: hypothetical protein PVH84_12130 [Candidatus Aminicenantes bacterium]|jgi:hypothetical protein
MTITQVEFNTLITCVGMACATVQGVTGMYAGYYRKKTGLLKTNDVLFRSHRAFGSFATMLYLLGLFAGITGLIGALTENLPPLELDSASFNIHTWGSFPVLFIFVWKTWLSYFKKAMLYGKKKWLGVAMFLAWVFTWITAAVSYYERTLPSNPQHPAPSFLLPYRLLWLQLAIPFVVGGAIALLTLRKAKSSERISSAP